MRAGAPSDGAAAVVQVGKLAFDPCRPLDGPTGSELLARGAALGEPLEAENRERQGAAVLRAVHGAYAASGAQWITANSFLAHAAPDARRSVVEAVALARSAVDGLPVAASFGPGAASPACYKDLACAAVVAGADLILLETFLSVAEAVAATRAAASVGAPVVTLMVFDERGRTLEGGERAGDAARFLSEAGAGAVGANCQEPDGLHRAVEEMAAAAMPWVPIVARPSAGIPRQDGESWVYPWAPGAWAEATAALRACGATLLGGCCGAGPAHIAALARRLSVGYPLAGGGA